MSDVVIITDPGEILLERHGVIEAHAGTGKTHTIVQTVLRILEQSVKDDCGHDRYVHIRELLLVTFTEKAAGELKQRIRRGIEERIAAIDRPDLKRHLESCLNNQHEALIGTIHAVCLRLLQTWPFETGVHFETGMVDDGEGLEGALRESMRIDWQEPATGIPLALEQLEQTGSLITDSHCALIRDTAKKLLDGERVILDRTAAGGHTLASLHNEGKGLAERRKNAEQDFPGVLDSLIASMENAAASGRMPDDRLSMLNKRVAELRQMRDTGRYEEAILKAPLTCGRSKICTTKESKKIPECAAMEQCAGAVAGHAFISALKEQNELGSFLVPALVCDAAALLAQRWERSKREKGVISYADMLRLTLHAVKSGGAFLSTLRSRLRFAIIDEFQDTSALQWEIFRRMFLTGNSDGGPRLFIVGDPKQSIFAFQGADVQSYLRAKEEILGNNGQVYSLVTNYRSLDPVVEGCNAILGRSVHDSKPDEDWFQFKGAGGISYPAEGKGAGLARAAIRSAPANTLQVPPVQVMAVEGNARNRLLHLAEYAAAVIKTLRGATVSVPDGPGWTELKIDYEHFAVIVEAHDFAAPFLERFEAEGIPAVKYKLEGVFQSPMARDLRALLMAVLHFSGDPAPRLAALLTYFFNRRPSDIDPAKDLEFCASGPQCSGDARCIAHALREWTDLADRRQWARLFRSITRRTMIRERLIGLVDGERHLADLRQVMDYCIEKLVRGALTLHQLVEHLGMLYNREISAGQDRNLHVLATDRSSVKVLTMHAAKGLEFPVVFAITGGSKTHRSGANALEWTVGDGSRRVMPVTGNSRSDRAAGSDRAATAGEILTQSVQERRRLLYVALTRAQVMLFMPAHFAAIVSGSNGDCLLQDSPLPSRNPDNDLTMRLKTLLSRGENRIQVFDRNLWNPPALNPSGAFPEAPEPVPLPDTPGIKELALPSRISIETSYTALSRRASLGRDIDRSEEEHEEAAPQNLPFRQPDLPGGKKSGDALHLAIEKLLAMDDLAQAIGDPGFMERLVREFLERNGILTEIALRTKKVRPGDTGSAAREAQAIAAAQRYIAHALTGAIALPGGGEVTIAGLPAKDRVPEMEFMVHADPHWVHGFIDLVFRVKAVHAEHPWRYFVLDWKSDRLDRYDRETVDACIREKHYDLQATLYCHALDRCLHGILGKVYAPELHLGGAIYVFLRSCDELSGSVATWVRNAEPKKDAAFVASQLPLESSFNPQSQKAGEP